MLLNLSDEKLPDFLHFEILLRADTKELIKNCSAVSKKWRAILAQKQFWIQKIEYDDHATALPPLDQRHLPLDFPKIALKRPFEKNLIIPYPNTSPRLTDSCNCMQSHQCLNKDLGGDRRWIYQQKNGFSHETVMIHDDSFDKNYDFDQIDSCLATSYFWSSKEILIDLIKEGLDPYVLDNLRPTITVYEYVSHRTDCASQYHMEAYLLPGEKNRKRNSIKPFNPTTDIIAKYETIHSSNQWEPQKWIKIEHSFREYPPGVRYVLFKSDGKDRQFWAGHFGSKMARPSVSVHYEFNNLADGIKNLQKYEEKESCIEGESSKNDLSEQPRYESQGVGSYSDEEEFNNNDFLDRPHYLFNNGPPDSVTLFPRRPQLTERIRPRVRQTLRNVYGSQGRH